MEVIHRARRPSAFLNSIVEKANRHHWLVNGTLSVLLVLLVCFSASKYVSATATLPIPQSDQINTSGTSAPVPSTHSNVAIELPLPAPDPESPWGVSEQWWSLELDKDEAVAYEDMRAIADESTYHLFHDLNAREARAGYKMTLYLTPKQRAWLIEGGPSNAAHGGVQTVRMDVEHEGSTVHYDDVKLRGYRGQDIAPGGECLATWRPFEATFPMRDVKAPFSRYIFLSLCNDETRLSYMSSIKLAKQFNLFPPRARFMDVGEWNATSGARETHIVFLVMEHPYDALMHVRPDAEMILRTREDEARLVGEEAMYATERRRQASDASRMALPDKDEVDMDSYVKLLALNSALGLTYALNAAVFYRGVGEKWQAMGWNMVRMATECIPELNPVEVKSKFMYCPRSSLDTAVDQDKALSSKLRSILAKETAAGGRLSKEHIQLAIGEAFIEYTTVQLYGYRDEALRLTAAVQKRIDEIQAAVTGA